MKGYRRSVLFVPASDMQKLDKARELPADTLIVDLEDSVGPDQKGQARKNLKSVFECERGNQELVLRVNAPGTPWYGADMQIALDLSIDALVIPKVDSAAQLFDPLLQSYGRTLWAMIETPLGTLHVEEIASHPQVSVLVLGTSDLVADLRARHMPKRENLFYAFSRLIMAARAHGKTALDGVHLDYRDTLGFEVACVQGRDFGFEGKTLIHPSQIEIANRIFSPSKEELDWAKRVIKVWRQAVAEGRGVATLGGQLIERLHVREAQRILDFSQSLSEI